MRLLKYPGIRLPRLYVTDDRSEAILMRESGIPYLLTSDDDETIVLCVLYHWLVERFPHIKWKKQLGLTSVRSYVVHVPGDRAEENEVEEMVAEVESDRSELTLSPEDESSSIDEGEYLRINDENESWHDVADDVREFTGTNGNERTETIVSLRDYMADEMSAVNVEQLQMLGLLPAFLSDVTDAIRTNLLSSMRWRDGWNKRLGCALGDFSVGTKAPNLIILDISGSIPNGISSTMLQLVDTLRSQAEADLIVTGGSSYYWPASAELPTPEWIRANVSHNNEAVMFYRILRERLAGRHFGNVISFGDNDCPAVCKDYQLCEDDDTCGIGIRVDRVMHFHTWRSDMMTGYAKWVHVANPDVEAVYDTSWCRMMDDR